MDADKSHDQQTVHVYDGIIEEDNHLPNWWLYTLYGTVAFALCYWVYYQAYAAGKSPLQEYQALRVAERKAEVARLMAAGAPTNESLEAMAKNASVVAVGKQVWTSTCVACHLSSGGGQIGPNLTDAYWIHGGQPLDILRTVRDGVIDKGMMAWGPQLGEEKVRAVTAYVLTLRNTNTPGGRAPQGDLVSAAPGAPAAPKDKATP